MLLLILPVLCKFYQQNKQCVNVNAKIFSSISICTSGNKSAKEVQTLLLEEIKQLESRLEKQTSKTNVLEKELED